MLTGTNKRTIIYVAHSILPVIYIKICFTANVVELHWVHLCECKSSLVTNTHHSLARLAIINQLRLLKSSNP